jgi:hypothetical protein
MCWNETPKVRNDHFFIKLKTFGILTMKKHCDGEHSNIWKVYVSEISLRRFAKTNPFEK